MFLNKDYCRKRVPARSNRRIARASRPAPRRSVLEGRQLHQCFQNTIPRGDALRLGNGQGGNFSECRLRRFGAAISGVGLQCGRGDPCCSGSRGNSDQCTILRMNFCQRPCHWVRVGTLHRIGLLQFGSCSGKRPLSPVSYTHLTLPTKA